MQERDRVLISKKLLPFHNACAILPLAAEKPGFAKISHGALAQMVARDIRIVEVRGSTPLCSTEALQINVCKAFSLPFYGNIIMQILHKIGIYIVPFRKK